MDNLTRDGTSEPISRGNVFFRREQAHLKTTGDNFLVRYRTAFFLRAGAYFFFIFEPRSRFVPPMAQRKALADAITEMQCSIVTEMPTNRFRRVDIGEQRCSPYLWENTRTCSHSLAKKRIELKMGRALPLDGVARLSYLEIESARRLERKEDICSRSKNKRLLLNPTKTLFLPVQLTSSRIGNLSFPAVPYTAL